VEIGEGVTRFHPGARVIATFVPDWIGGAWAPTPGSYGRGMAVQGVLATEIVAGEDELVAAPAHLSFEEAATLPCAAVTAWSALCAGASPLPGESVLVQGSGGVSMFALQFARLFGQHIIATSSTPTKLKLIQKLGAHDLVDYRAIPDWELPVLAATGGMGVDRTVEIGGAATFAKSIAATRAGGRIAVVGLLTGAPAPGAELFMRGLTLYPIRVGSRQDFEAMNRAISWHCLQPVIDRLFDFDEAVPAMKYLEQGQHVGKIVIRVQ
ncbi:MAG: NAD(P)-dependent alcohol dehydrogenase, partial [Acidocella sp.]|nr:NAD(P)-dependent alcohol dehydrogenase [Acidocella sp.]